MREAAVLLAHVSRVFGTHAELRREHARDLVQNSFGDGQLDPTVSGEFDQLKRFAAPEQGANEDVRIGNDPFHSAAAVFGARLVHGIDGDLYGFLVGDGAHHLASRRMLTPSLGE